MRNPDIYLSIEETATALDRFTRENIHWKGAEIADVLDALADSDSYLDVVEPMHERAGVAVPEEGLLRACTLATVLIEGPAVTTWERVEPLVVRVRACLAASAARGSHGHPA